MSTSALHDLTLAESADLIKSRKLSPVELTKALLERTETFEPQINAFITKTPEIAMDAAKAAEAEIMRGNNRGPMHGVPFAVKDIYDTANVLTSGHSRTCIDRVPTKDATTVARLRAAGGVLTGIPNEISVEGHADTRQSAAPFATNWELSAARATMSR